MSVAIHRTSLLVCGCLFGIWWGAEAARVLVVTPIPMRSHQAVFRPFTRELARRGHQVVVLTAAPAYPPNRALPNLIEIDIHNVSHNLWTRGFRKHINGKASDYNTQILTSYEILYDLFSMQLWNKEIRQMLANESQNFDLVVIPYFALHALPLGHVYRAPVILMSTAEIPDDVYEYMGVPIHPFVYPDVRRTKRYNLSSWEQAWTLYNRILLHRSLRSLNEKQEVVIREMYGGDLPPLPEMLVGAEMEFVNMHPVWEGCRPVPPTVVHLGGMNCEPPKPLPGDLKSLMDTSERGVIYMSFGSNVDPFHLPAARLTMFARVFATLPYDVVWKWKDAPTSLPKNVYTYPWLPQVDLLQHEKLVLFITQGGLQSSDEALCAGVPLLGVPLLSDQWVNVENYERLGVGLGLDLHTFSETQLRETIEKLINDKGYRSRSARLGRVLLDRPQSALAQAMWAAERTIRLRGRRLPTPPSPFTWDDIIQALLLIILAGPVALICLVIFLYKLFSKCVTQMCGYFAKIGRSLTRAWYTRMALK